MKNQQQVIDQSNSVFWDELCGTAMARSLGITEISEDTLRRFDRAYFEYYPYLAGYVKGEPLQGKRVLEIGLGYGSLGGLIILQGARYFGLDLARGPARMMQFRLGISGSLQGSGSGQGSALALPFANDYFDYVYTIGCLHHTGNLARAVQEVHRVLKPGGRAIVMLYNRNSFRQLVHVRWIQFRDWLKGRMRTSNLETYVRAMYDSDASGEAAPYTEYVTKAQVRDVFGAFSRVAIDVQNFDEYALAGGLITLPRRWFLNTLARLLGLDLYIRAVKARDVA